MSHELKKKIELNSNRLFPSAVPEPARLIFKVPELSAYVGRTHVDLFQFSLNSISIRLLSCSLTASRTLCIHWQRHGSRLDGY